MEMLDKYNTQQIHKDLLVMMKDVHSFCCAHGIKYSLCGGSLLGAIRHNGFIPWDDDMDIMLDRNNYELLLSKFHECDGYTIERELWIYRIKKKDSEKVNGYFPTIDIFVIDNTPDKKLSRKFKTFKIKMLQGMMKKKVNYSNYSFFGKICVFCTRFIGMFFTDKFKWSMYERISKKGNKNETATVTCYNDLFKLLHLRYDKDTMNFVELHEFEDTMFSITCKWNSYLSTQYGDYMTPPDEKNRKPEHCS